MPFANQHSARQQSPSKYKKFRRANDKGGSGVDFIYGITGKGKAEVQSIRFDPKKFSVEQAKSWLSDHKMKTGVTAASGGQPGDHADAGGAAATSASPAGVTAITVPTALRDETIQYKYSEEESSEMLPEDMELDGEDLLDSILDNDLDMDELKKGMEHEMEHTSDRNIALKIALDHLIEHDNYYTKLEEVFKEYNESATLSPKKEYEMKMDNDNDAKDEPDDDEDDPDFALGFHDNDKTLCVEAFEEGTHTDASGQTASWSKKELAEIAQKANEQLSTKPIPVCIGHPKDNSPAYGWVSKMKTVGGKLVAKLSELNPSFVDALKNGAYKGRSISLYDDNRVRHIGFLGGAQPAIEGLQPLSFTNSDKYRTFTFSEESSMDAVKEKELNFLQKLLAKFKIDVEKEKASPEFAEFHEAQNVVAMEEGKKVTPASTNAATIQNSIVEKETVDPGITATEKVRAAEAHNEANEAEDENAKLKEQITALESKVKMLEATLAKSKATNNDFCETLIKEGKLRPADKEYTLLALNAQAELDQLRNFSEDSDASSLKKMKAMLVNAPKVVEFGEFPSLPAAEETHAFPAVNDMSEYIQKKMDHKMLEQDKLGLTNKVSYWDMLKQCHAECQAEDPVKYSEYVKKNMIPQMGQPA